MAMSTLVPRYTAAEVRAFEDPHLRYEVIGGELFMTPAPGTPHQLTVAELVRLFGNYLDRYGLGVVIAGPYEVEFAEDTAVQPDVLVVLGQESGLLPAKRLHTAPSLVIEVISYSSKRTDRLQKRQLYMDEGVDEYWIFDPEQRHVERWPHGAIEPEIQETRLVWRPSAAVPALEIDLVALFAKVWGWIDASSSSP